MVKHKLSIASALRAFPSPIGFFLRLEVGISIFLFPSSAFFIVACAFVSANAVVESWCDRHSQIWARVQVLVAGVLINLLVFLIGLFVRCPFLLEGDWSFSSMRFAASAKILLSALGLMLWGRAMGLLGQTWAERHTRARIPEQRGTDS